MIKVEQDEHELLSKYIYEKSGVYLDHSKVYLIETRLKKLLLEYDCKSYGDLYHKAKSDITKALEKKIIDAITTGETLFFRDASPFEALQHKIIPDLIDRRSTQASGGLKTRLRIWSAACSTGQEVYSIGIVLKELIPDIARYNIQLHGTDISDAAVAQASKGQYNKFEIERGLAGDKLQKYFTEDSQSWNVNNELKSMATFRKLNLMEPFSGLQKYDVVFCRNVAIYFTPDDRKALFNKIADILEPDGFLIIGSTESLTGVCQRFAPQRHVRSIFYQLKQEP